MPPHLSFSEAAALDLDGDGLNNTNEFLAGTDHWRSQPEFLDFALDSPLPAIVTRPAREPLRLAAVRSVFQTSPSTQRSAKMGPSLASSSRAPRRWRATTGSKMLSSSSPPPTAISTACDAARTS